MFQKHSERGYVPALPGIERKTTVYGERTLLSEFRLKAGSQLPRHSHPYEQTGYLVKGRIRLKVDMDEYDVTPGDSWCISIHAEHSAEALEDSLAVEVFAPVREDYLPEG